MELKPKFSTEIDLPPEYCHYKDEGCELAESCLDCPFLRCIYDEPGGEQRLLKRQRDREMARLFKDKGKEVKELALIFGVSHRTVQLTGSYKVYLEDIAVARNLPAAEMINGGKTAVVFFDEHNPKEAVVVAVYS